MYARGLGSPSLAHQSTDVDGRHCATPIDMPGACDLSRLWFIGELDNAFGEALGRNKPKVGRFALPEEQPPLPQHKRMDREIKDIEQVVLEQCLSKKTVAVDEQIPSFLLLEPAHFSHYIASNDGRVVPMGVFQR